MREPVAQNEKEDSGFALFVVLSFLLLAAAVTTPLLTSARIEALVSRNHSQTTRDKVLMRGILEVSGLRYFELYQGHDAKPVRHALCRLDNLNFAFDFQDHSGLIDLNAASEDVLALGFESIGIPLERAKILAKEVVRFRSVENGASPDAAVTGPRGGYKNALFEHVSELADLLAPGDSANLELDNAFTVHSGTGTVDEAAASTALLDAIAMLAATDKYFLVNDARRTNAVTVSITMHRANQHPVKAKGIVGRGQNGIGVQLLRPIVWVTEPAELTIGESIASVNCDEFFDLPLLHALQKVTS